MLSPNRPAHGAQEGVRAAVRGSEAVEDVRTDGRGKPREADVVEGKDGSLRVKFEADTFTARYRLADGRWDERSTCCTSEDAARHLLHEWEAEEDRIRCGRATRAEVEARDEMMRPILHHLKEYLEVISAASPSNDQGLS